MTTANKHIKVASVLYLISSLLVVPFVPTLGSVLLILGIILLADSLLVAEELKKNKVSLIIISVISFLLNIPAAIFIILAIGELDTIQLERSNAPPATSESKKIDFTFWNRVLDQQWLNLKWHTPEGVEILPNKSTYVNLDQKHGGFNKASAQAEIRVDSALSGRLDLVVEITSQGRYTKTFIPIVLIVR